MTLDWRANEDTEKLPLSRYMCYALNYGVGSVLEKNDLSLHDTMA